MYRIEIPIPKLADAIRNLQATEATITDKTKLAAVESAIRRMEEIQAELEAAQTRQIA